MMHRPLIRRGTLGKVLPWYAIALVPTLAMVTGLMIAIESIVHYTTNPSDDPNIKAFGLPFNAASPITWGISLALIVIGFVVARYTWIWVGHAWYSACLLYTSDAADEEDSVDLG